MLMALFYVHKMVEIPHKTNLITSVIFISNFLRRDQVYNDFKDFLNFWNDLDVGIVSRFKVISIEIIFKKVHWEQKKIFQIYDLNILKILLLVCIYPWIYTIFPNSSQKNHQVAKICHQKNVGWWGERFNPFI